MEKGRQKSNRDDGEREHDQCPQTRQIAVASSPAQGFTPPTPHTMCWESNHPYPQAPQGRLSVFHHINNPIFS